jgi:hypothetical protein
LCSGADARTLLYETIDQAILPQLETLELDAKGAWRRRHEADALLRQ